MNLWYKRLGCAMLMAMAVCGKERKKKKKVNRLMWIDL